MRSSEDSCIDITLSAFSSSESSLKMLRSALRTQLRTTGPRSRNFVSTVLLTKAWENESINDLRREAKRRGLSGYVQRDLSPRIRIEIVHRQGNKATLISRLQSDDEHKSLATAPAVSPQVSQVRHASTTEVPGIPTTGAPTPLPKSYPKDFLDVKMPNLSEPEPELPIQIVRALSTPGSTAHQEHWTEPY